MAALSDEARIRELAEVIRSKCAQAQQIRQQPPGVTVTSASSVIGLQVYRIIVISYIQIKSSIVWLFVFVLLVGWTDGCLHKLQSVKGRTVEQLLSFGSTITFFVKFFSRSRK